MTARLPMPPLDEVRMALSYDPDTGVFRWIKPAGTKLKPGATAGYSSRRGVVRIRFMGTLYLAHRLAWWMTHGEEPDHLDHVNGRPGDNRLINLRVATQSQNGGNRRINSNSTSGVKGVSWHKLARKWQAKIQVDGKLQTLGYFDDSCEAHEAYCVAARAGFGDYANDGERCLLLRPPPKEK